MNPVILIFVRKWWPAIAVAIILAALLTLSYCKGRSAGKSGEVIEQQQREIETQRDLGNAAENASGQRMEDAAETAQQEKELNDALNAIEGPDRQRALRGCVIMRQQGRDTSNIPACR